MKIKVDTDHGKEDWLLMFKNETHNHPTEIEPFGGAATCIGGCIRDPLSGRAYVHQAMRVTWCSPRAPLEETMAGKLPQRTIVTKAAAGYSSYGNQIGLATGQVDELYHPGYAAKRMEIGAVIAAAPAANVRRGAACPRGCGDSPGRPNRPGRLRRGHRLLQVPHHRLHLRGGGAEGQRPGGAEAPAPLPG